jgi:hypothetical protein
MIHQLWSFYLAIYEEELLPLIGSNKIRPGAEYGKSFYPKTFILAMIKYIDNLCLHLLAVSTLQYNCKEYLVFLKGLEDKEEEKIVGILI